MASDDDVIRLIAKFEGEEEAKRLKAAVELADQKFKSLYDTLGAGHAQTKAAAGGLSDLKAQLTTAQDATKGMGQAMMQAGYAVDDLQYGFKGIANNIQPILQSIPALASIAPVISIVAIAAYQLYEHFDDLAGLFGQGRTKSQAEEMEELGKKTAKTAEETLKLAKYEELRNNIKAQNGKTGAETKLAEGVNKAISEGPIEAIEKGVEKHFGQRIQAMADIDPRTADTDLAGKKAKLEELRKAGVDPRTLNYKRAENAVDAAQKMTDQIYADARAKFLGELATKPDTARAVADAARANPDDFGPGGSAFAERLRDAGKTPKQVADEKDAKEQEQAEAMAENFHNDAELKRADWEQKARDKEEDEDAKAQEHLDRTMRDGASKHADFDEKGRLADEDEDAKAQEHFDKHQRANTEKQAQWEVVDGPKYAAESAIQARKDAIDKGEKATAGTGLDARTDDAFLRYALRSGGHGEAAQKALEAGLKREFLGRGMNEEQASIAAKEKAGERASKVADEINGNLASPQMHAPQRIGMADFARSVESAGAADAKKQLEQMVSMNRILAEIQTNTRGGARAGP
jgi:hypothetical protein